MTAAAAGATAVIQPGGSMRDDDVIKAADEADTVVLPECAISATRALTFMVWSTFRMRIRTKQKLERYGDSISEKRNIVSSHHQ